MIRELRLANFKAWPELHMPLAPITGIFGANSSGKSSVLQALLLLKQSLESADRSLPLHFGDERDYAEMGTFADVIHGHVADKGIDFGLTWDLPEQLTIEDPENPDRDPLAHGDQIVFSTSIVDEGDGATVRTISYTLGPMRSVLSRMADGIHYELAITGARNGYRLTRTQGRPWDLPRPIKFHGFPDQAMTYFQNTGFLPDLQLNLEGLFAQVRYLGPLREQPRRRYVWSGGEPLDMGRRGERTVDAILARGKQATYSLGKGRRRQTLEQRIAHWLRELGLIHSFKVSPIWKGTNLYQVKVRREPRSTEVLLTDVGFGVSQILPVIALCYYVPEGSTVLLEQPDIHLHPAVQMGLADVFIDAMQTRKVQIILESHSEHLLLRLQRRLAEGGLNKSDAALYFCESGPGSAARLRTLTVDDAGNITNWPKDFFGDRFGEVAAQQKAALKQQVARESTE